MSILRSKKLDEESFIREEKVIFRGSLPEQLKIIHTLVCFTNYKGGNLIIYEVENDQDFKKFFDAANIENAINSYIEPPIEGLISVKLINKKRVSIKIKPSPSLPHFYKTDGSFINSKGKEIFIFKKGSIGIRRSGRNDVYNSLDFEQIFKKKIKEILGSIQNVVIKQPMSELAYNLKKIKDISKESIAYKYKPNDPSAISIRQILDTEPFISLEEELNAAVKSWKTSGALMTDTLIAKAYKESNKIVNKEWVKLLFLSSLEKLMPFCLWGTKLRRNELHKFIIDIIKKDSFPSVHEIIKIIIFLSPSRAKKIINILKNSKYVPVIRLSREILNEIKLMEKPVARLIKIFKINNKYKIKLQNENVFVDINKCNKNNLMGLASRYTVANKRDRSELKRVWRVLDLIIYGKQLT